MATMESSSTSKNAHAVSCCAPQSTQAQPTDTPGTDPGVKAGLLASGGAVIAAVLASACCWLPLALIGLGASTAGVAGFFEAYRPYFLSATALLLGAGFHYVYLRKPKCAPSDACAVPNPRLQRLNKISLWLATALVLGFATFPNYVGVFFGDDGAGTAAAAAQAPTSITRSYSIEGMTCEGCSGHIRTAVGAVTGVGAVEVSYAEGSATVVFTDGHADDAAVLRAIGTAGYVGHAPTTHQPSR